MSERITRNWSLLDFLSGVSKQQFAEVIPTLTRDQVDAFSELTVNAQNDEEAHDRLKRYGNFLLTLLDRKISLTRKKSSMIENVPALRALIKIVLPNTET